MREAGGAACRRPPGGADTASQEVAASVEPQPVAANVEPQPVASPLTGAAIFLVAAIGQGPQHADAVRGLCADLAGLIRAVGFRDLDGHLTCVTGFGAQAWDRVAPGRLAGGRRPAGLHPFREIRAGQRHAVSTPGDMLFHIRAARMDLCFELATQITGRLGDRGDGAGRGARVPLLRRPGSGRVRGRHREPGGPGRGPGHDHRRRGPGVRRRQLRDRPEVPARPGRLERDTCRAAGADHRARPSCPTSSSTTWSSPATRTTR